MRFRRIPLNSLSASDSTGTDDPASAAADTSTCRGVPRPFGAGAVAGIAGCPGDDEGQTDDDSLGGICFEGSRRTYAHDDANTTFLRDGTVISESTIGCEPDSGIGSIELVVIDEAAYTPSDSIRALDPAAGKELWVVQGEEWTTSVVLDGIVCSLGVTVHGLNQLALYRVQTGRLFRTIELPDRPWTPPAFSNDRKTLFLGLDDERICAVDIDAAGVRWTRSLFGAVRRLLAANLHLIPVVTEGQRLYRLGADGRTRWQAPTRMVETVVLVVGDERVYIAGWDYIVALERRNGDVVWEDDRGVHERLAFDGDRLYAVRGSLRAFDNATGEEWWRYDPEETVSATSVVGDAVYVGTGRDDFVALNRAGDGGLFGDHERWSISLGCNVGHLLAATDRRVLCSFVCDDGLSSITVVADVDEPSAGMTADAGGSEP